MNLHEVIQIIGKKKGLKLGRFRGGLVVSGRDKARIREENGNIIFELFNGRPETITDEKHLNSKLKQIQPVFPRNFQTKLLSLLALNNGVLSIAKIEARLGLTRSQFNLTKRELLRKGRITMNGSNVILKGIYAGHNFEHRVCYHLTSKKKRSYWCPVKKVFVDDRHYKDGCGCYEALNYAEPLKGPYCIPVCKGWV